MNVVNDRRHACLVVATELEAHRNECHYTQEPIRWSWHNSRTISYPFFADCSSGVTAVCWYAHGNDPNGMNFLAGDTETILSHAETHGLLVAKHQILPADFILFGPGPKPVHVVMAMNPGTDPDPWCWSHGQEGDPHFVRLSVLESLGAPTFVHNHTDIITVVPDPKPVPYHGAPRPA